MSDWQAGKCGEECDKVLLDTFKDFGAGFGACTKMYLHCCHWVKIDDIRHRQYSKSRICDPLRIVLARGGGSLRAVAAQQEGLSLVEGDV
jgi:hypothetical protein